MATKKEYENYMKSVLGNVDRFDVGYCDRRLRICVDGQEMADKALLAVVIIGIVEFVALLIASQIIEASPDLWIGLGFYVVIKSFVWGLIFSDICSRNLGSQREWNEDKMKIATTKICLAKMGKLKSDVDLEGFELRERSRLDDLDIRNYI